MSVETILFLLRLLSGAALLTILLAIFWAIWRDYHSTTLHIKSTRRTYGTLIALAEIDGQFTPTGETHPLLPLTSLGRSPTNAVVLNDTYASSEHALLALRSGQWWLEDRRSRNGTLLNGEPINAPIIVTDGDIISIGNFNFRIDLEK